MIIAFDGNKAANNKAGLGNYSRFIIKTLAERYPDCLFDVYVRKARHPELLEPLKTCPNVNIKMPRSPLMRLFPGLWESLCVPRELEKTGTAIWHGLANVLPRPITRAKGVKTIVTIHDLIFLILPYTYSWIDRHIFSAKFLKASQLANCVVAVSRCTATDLRKYFRTPSTKIRVAYQGCNEAFRHPCQEQLKNDVKQHYHLPDNYILSVGTIERRKNTALIVKALEQFPDLHLVLVGRRTKYTTTVEETAMANGTSARLHILEGVGLKDLPAIYQQARIFIYPSEYEGFGIPILEALCSRVPVIAATGSCLEEAGGPTTIYIDPQDPQALADAISKILSDNELRNNMIDQGLLWAEQFTDAALADSLMSLYHETLGINQ